MLWQEIGKPALVTVAAMAVATGLAFLMGDCAGGTSALYPGVVTGRHYVAPYTSFTCGAYDDKGNCTVYIPVEHPPEWYLLVAYDTPDGRKAMRQSVGSNTFATAEGTTVTVRCLRGKWTGGYYLPRVVEGL